MRLRGMKTEIKVKVTRTLESKEIKGTDYSICQVTTKCASFFPNTKESFFIKTKEIKGIDLTKHQLPKSPNKLCLMSDEFLDYVQKNGFIFDDTQQKKGVSHDFKDYPKFNNLVFMDWGSHMLFQLDEKTPLSVAIHFDYIDARMDNEFYDLDKVYAHLKKRKDTIWHPDSIDEIPYYNREEGRTHCLNFTWAPPQKVYEKMWAECKKINPRYPCTADHDAIRKLDLLGIEKFKKQEKKYG